MKCTDLTELTIIRPNDTLTFAVNAGENIYSFLVAKGLISAPCGGRGVCGKCRILIEDCSLPVLPSEQKFFTQEEMAAGWRLACLHDIGTKNLRIRLAGNEKIAEIKVDGYLPDFELSEENGFGLMIDIGSTTVAAGLVDLRDGHVSAHASCLNSQAVYGQDVLSRISYANQEQNGLKKLQRAIVENINDLTRKLVHDPEILNDIRKVIIAGNTTMIHLLSAHDPSSLGQAPYNMAFSGPLEFNGNQIGLLLDCPVYCIPAVSAFIGGDITSGILACRLFESKDRTLFIDIGTNGEIILADRGKLIGCSCATGPALEGMNISSGTIAKNGAIEDLSITDGVINYTTIGGSAPIGLCGSGILSTVAELYRTGLMDANGRLQKIAPIETVEGKRRLVIGNGIFLTQQDVRQVQLAKGAILSGIRCLLKAAEVEQSMLDRVIVAGQFGAHLKASDLLDSGLLPKIELDRIFYAGNTSLSGAYLCLVGRGERDRCEKVAKDVNYLELATLPGYQQEFVSCMSFDS